jgi:N-carbamoyl-L-amino-acid hydrolase
MSSTVNRERLRRLLDESSAIGLDPAAGPGLYRAALSEPDTEGREWLVSTMKDIGLEVFTDGALNIHGRLSSGTASKSVVMTGSHHDTVRGGGRLDGALGVIAGIECLARIKELGCRLSTAWR